MSYYIDKSKEYEVMEVAKMTPELVDVRFNLEWMIKAMNVNNLFGWADYLEQKVLPIIIAQGLKSDTKGDKNE